jgi:hypothetical protein
MPAAIELCPIVLEANRAIPTVIKSLIPMISSLYFEVEFLVEMGLKVRAGKG